MKEPFTKPERPNGLIYECFICGVVKGMMDVNLAVTGRPAVGPPLYRQPPPSPQYIRHTYMPATAN